MSFLIADPPLHRAKRDSPSASAASRLDLNVGAGDPHRVGFNGLPGGRPQNRPGPDVELRPVPRTGHFGSLYRPFRQRSPSMGARVAQGIEATVHTKQGNLLALHLDQFGLLVCQLVGRGHLDEMGHRSLLFSEFSTFGGNSVGGLGGLPLWRRTAASRGGAFARTPLAGRIRAGRSHTDGRSRTRDRQRGDGGRGRARGPCPGPSHRRAGGGAGMRSGEREEAGNARSSAIPPQGHLCPAVYSPRRAPASVDADSITARVRQTPVR
jgi:hypothetical protein